MKRTMLAVALALLALTLLACGGDDNGNENPADNGIETDNGDETDNEDTAVIEPGSTPEETFEAIRRAGMNRDGGAIFDLLAPEAQRGMISALEGLQAMPAEMRGPAAEQLGISAEDLEGMTPREFFAISSQKALDSEKDMAEEAENSKLVDTTIEGDHATLTVDTNGKQEKMHLLKVDGKWYLVGGRK